MPTISRREAIAKGYPINKWFIQTILASKDLVSKKQAVKELKENKARTDDYRETTNFMRFMQNNPVRGAHYQTMRTTDNKYELVYQRFT